MNVYFTSSIVGKKQYLRDYKNIISIVEKFGNQVLSDHIINTNESQIRMETKEERLKFHKQLTQWIINADCMVAEVTFPSISVGYEISMALEAHKPVLVLYKEGDPPSLLACHDGENLVCEKYTLNNLKNIIADFLNFAKGSIDTRFTFFISPQINQFLEKISKKGNLPKSVYLRKLIEKEMGKK